MKKIRKIKKAQNEIVGFVIIVVIVVIIGLFFLAFYLRREPVRTENENAQNFLKASMKYTTTCNPDITPINLKELTKRCYDKKNCKQEDSCKLLNLTFSKILDSAWDLGPDRPTNYYQLNIYYREGEEKESKIEPILSIEKGNCTGSRNGAEEFFPYKDGNIFTTMEICYD